MPPNFTVDFEMKYCVETHKICILFGSIIIFFLLQHIYKTVPMSSVTFTVSAILPSIIFLIIFFVFTMLYFIMLVTTPQFPPRGLIKFLSIQDLAYP